MTATTTTTTTETTTETEATSVRPTVRAAALIITTATVAILGLGAANGLPAQGGAADVLDRSKTLQAGPKAQPAKSPRPTPAARLALKTAAAVLEKAKGTKGEARKMILREAAAAYAKVMVDFAAEPAGAAPACFAAAEIWRKQGELARAAELYHKSIDLAAIRFRRASSTWYSIWALVDSACASI